MRKANRNTYCKSKTGMRSCYEYSVTGQHQETETTTYIFAVIIGRTCA